ncbi:MAG: acetyl-CoA decarbonylase/synthase complex subunit gamma [Methanomicrobiales archaeon]|nr:acetyl-CoA decarbonylase/synthase complex subunit gamma [Methanomicrobiales archaeon]MDI6876569.1 acetyl-CoA decarbonylase/synthase complex subunit gamma [Methanomicrobiales archaeon]
MALKALDIYKMLPKKNCKECGYPTCMAFAMKIASGKVGIEDCPYIDEETKRSLGAVTRPPIQRVKIGVGERSIVLGEETVMYRHEKTFYHPPALMFRISDLWPRDRIRSVLERVEKEIYTRIGQDLSINGVAIANDSLSPERFGETLATVEDLASLPEVLMADDPAAQERGLEHCGAYRPLLHGATAGTYEEMCRLAMKFGCPLSVRGATLEELANLTQKCGALGVEKLVLDPAPATLQDYLRDATAIRRSALARTAPALGYPIFLDASATGIQDAAIALGILKYASVIVTDPLDAASRLPALILRQNIYTDPQKPIQVAPGLYRVNNPDENAPVLLTVNFSLTYFTVLGYLESGRIACHLLVVDTEGMSVLTAVAAGKLNETVVAGALQKFGVGDVVKHRTLVIPGYAAPLSGRIEDASGWKVVVGPRDAAEIAEFLETGV